MRYMRTKDLRSFLQAHHDAVRRIAAKDYPPAVIEQWAPLPITEKHVELLSSSASRPCHCRENAFCSARPVYRAGQSRFRTMSKTRVRMVSSPRAATSFALAAAEVSASFEARKRVPRRAPCAPSINAAARPPSVSGGRKPFPGSQARRGQRLGSHATETGLHARVLRLMPRWPGRASGRRASGIAPSRSPKRRSAGSRR